MKNFIKNSIQSNLVFYRYFRKKGLKRFFKENILESDSSNRIKALSLMLGLFVGLTPLWGFHTAIVIFLASYFRLNKLLSYMATHISAPPFIPFIIAASLYIGAPFVKGQNHFQKSELTFQFIKENLLQYIIGSSILAISTSLLLGTISYFLLQAFNPKGNSHN